MLEVSITKILALIILFPCVLLLPIELYSQDTIKHSERANGHNSPYRIPINEILAAPDVYQETPVQVVGYLNLNWEADAIYLSLTDFKNNRYKKGLWVHLNQFKFPQSKKCNERYVIIEGVFDANDHGHLNLWGGAVKNISSLKLYRKTIYKKL